MFDWINTMTTCPTLSSMQYPKLDPKLQAQYDQAVTLSRADGIVDQTHIAALYKEAAEKGHWPSMHNLAVHYYEGNGIEESDEKALYWWRQIETLDIPDGYTHMALVYRKGIGVEKNPDKALEYMSKAAQLGDPDAQFMLGKYLYHPLRRKPDAYKMLACAVEQDHRDAALELAAHYEVDEDFEKSYHFYRKGAMLGSDSCLNALSNAYAHQPKYPTISHFWLK
ncbi:MAG: sel1 repeat family protein [Gammaproteobacteria bacterium]|nr:sel1 repeat family protein [Gammaproteobacteria bacterium]